MLDPADRGPAEQIDVVLLSLPHRSEISATRDGGRVVPNVEESAL